MCLIVSGRVLGGFWVRVLGGFWGGAGWVLGGFWVRVLGGFWVRVLG